METGTGKAIGIVMTYNCSTLVEGLFAKIPQGCLDELIIVDDGSKDVEATRAVAAKHGIPFFTHPHSGYGGNLKFGFEKALERGAEYMFELHGDGQFTPAIPQALAELRKGADFVMGSRFTNMWQCLRDGMSPIRFLANLILSFVSRLVLRIPWTEFHSGFRGYSRRLVETTGLKTGSLNYNYSFELIVVARYRNLRFAEVPVRADYNADHTSISLRKSAGYFFMVFLVLTQYIFARMGFKSALFR
jgi:glycosyltransferase involved in cell wall biosynthesis